MIGNGRSWGKNPCIGVVKGAEKGDDEVAIRAQRHAAAGIEYDLRGNGQVPRA